MKNFLKKKNKKNDKGFTLVEALISITILMISVAAPLNLASQGLIAADIAQRQIVAFYLAQDATEWVIYKKSSNKLAGNNFDHFLNLISGCVLDGTDPDHGCAIDSAGNNTLIACTQASCSEGKLYKTFAGQYTLIQTGNSKTPFTRYTKITPIGSPPYSSARVETVVTWTSADGKTQTYTLKNILAY